MVKDGKITLRLINNSSTWQIVLGAAHKHLCRIQCLSIWSREIIYNHVFRISNQEWFTKSIVNPFRIYFFPLKFFGDPVFIPGSVYESWGWIPHLPTQLNVFQKQIRHDLYSYMSSSGMRHEQQSEEHIRPTSPWVAQPMRVPPTRQIRSVVHQKQPSASIRDDNHHSRKKLVRTNCPCARGRTVFPFRGQW